MPARIDGSQVTASSNDVPTDEHPSLGSSVKQALVQEAKNSVALWTGQSFDALSSGAHAVYDGAKALVKDTAGALDYRANIDQLAPGDSYKVGGSVFGSVEGARAYGAAGVDVARTVARDGEPSVYTVAFDAELGGGEYGEIGGKLGAKLDAEAAMTWGLAGRCELKFASAAEAKDAAGLLLKRAAGNALSPPESAFLSHHLSAVEVRGNEAAEVMATLGVKNVAGAFGSARVKAEDTVRIQLDEAKRSVVIKESYSGEIAGSFGLRRNNGKKEEALNEARGAAAGLKGEGVLSITRKFDLPADLDAASLVRDPVGAVKSAAGTAIATHEEKVTLELNASGGGFGAGGGVKTELEIKASPRTLLESGFASDVFNGDVERGLKSLGDVEVEAKVTGYRTHGGTLAPAATLMGVGGGFDVGGTRTELAREPSYEFKGTATEAARQLPDATYLRAAARSAASLKPL